MRRREVIALIAGATAAWPLAARAEAIRRVGLLFINSVQGAATLGLVGAIIQGFKEHGWIEGQNIAFECRFADGKQNALPNLARRSPAASPGGATGVAAVGAGVIDGADATAALSRLAMARSS
jgi:putative tryptophan/tyrosine transport system substrate-binding protein